MKANNILLLSFVLAIFNSYGQQSNSFVDPVESVCKLCNINNDQIKANCANIPLLKFSGYFNSNEQFIAEYKKWIHTNPEQYSYLKEKCAQTGNNISWISMGIEDAIEPFLPDSVRHGYTYFVYKILGMDYKRVHALAPNLPVFTSTGNFKKDSTGYDDKYIKWSRSYHSEYENIYNSDENKLQLGSVWEQLELGMPADSLPSSRTESDAKFAESREAYLKPEMPHFLYAPYTADKPLINDKSDMSNLSVEEYEKVQKWLWVNDTVLYTKWIASLPALPQNFAVAKFRLHVVKMLNPNPDGYFYISGTSGDISGEAFDYHHPMGHPDFMYAAISSVKPVSIKSSSELSTLSTEELMKLKKWLYFFEPDSFVVFFGNYPVLTGFKTDFYKADIIEGRAANPDEEKYYTH